MTRARADDRPSAPSSPAPTPCCAVPVSMRPSVALSHWPMTSPIALGKTDGRWRVELLGGPDGNQR